MPQPRKYKSNAERQAAYRERKARQEAIDAAAGAQPRRDGTDALVRRVMAADRRAQT